jgi:chromosome segregation ATPase
MSEHKRKQDRTPIAQEKSSIFQSSFQSTSSSPPFSTTSFIVKEDAEEKQRLEKQNFELRMKIFHLEEQLKKYHDSEQRNELSNNHSKNELHNLRVKNEELQIEIEQRELLMVKASTMINTLKQELDRCKDQVLQQEEFELKFQQLKLSHQQVIDEMKQQLQQMELQLQQHQFTISATEKEKNKLEEKLVSFFFGHFFAFFSLLITANCRKTWN